MAGGNLIAQRWSSMSEKPFLVMTSASAGWQGFEFQEIEVPMEGTFDGQSSTVHLYSICKPMKLRFGGKKTFTTYQSQQELVLPRDGILGAWIGAERGSHLFIDQEAVERLSHRPFSNNKFDKSSVHSPIVRHLLNALRIDTQNCHPNGPMLGETIAAALIHHLLASTASHTSTPEHKGMSNRELGKVREFIESNLAQQISLEKISKEMNVSIRHLCRTFQLATGQSLYRYIILRRVERAKQLIGTGQLNMMEVAASAGFAHQAHMAHTFKKLLGAKPSQFKNF